MGGSSKSEARSSKQIEMTEILNLENTSFEITSSYWTDHDGLFEPLKNSKLNLFRISDFGFRYSNLRSFWAGLRTEP